MHAPAPKPKPVCYGYYWPRTLTDMQLEAPSLPCALALACLGTYPRTCTGPHPSLAPRIRSPKKNLQPHPNIPRRLPNKTVGNCERRAGRVPMGLPATGRPSPAAAIYLP